MNLKEIFGTNVRQHRKARHMSQAELAEANGLAFTYFDDAGATPAFTTGIVSIGLTVRGRSAGPVSGQGYISDSIITRITLRNNRRF